jgi:hypothetical protein
MSALTQDELQEIANFEKAAPTLFTGFLMDNSPRGRSNATLIAGFLEGRSQKYTVANLTNAVIELQFVLSWAPGTEPVAVPSDNRTRTQRARDGGINPYQPTQYNDNANGIESDWAKDIRLGKEANAARLAAKAKADLRFRETNQVVQGVNGRQNYAASNALNEEARRRHAAEDARDSGKVPVATGFRVIPEGTAIFAPYSADEIKAYLAKRKGGHLLR